MEKVLCNIFLCILCVEGFAKYSFNPAAKRYTHHALQTNVQGDGSTPAITERILELTQKEDIVFVVDVENVRGKTSFELDHCDLLDRLTIWASLRKNAFGRTLAVVDHGSKSSAHLLNHDTTNAALCVSFAGPIVKADDIIARDVRWLLSSNVTQHVVVITADQELSWRCRSAARSPDSKKLNSIMRKLASTDSVLRGGGRGKRGKSRAARKKQYLQLHQESEEEEVEEDLHSNHTNEVANDTADLDPTPTVEIITPQRFLEDLEQALREWLSKQEHSTTVEEIDIDDIPIPTPITTMQSLFHLCGEILSIESSLRKKCSLRKRHTLTEELREKKAAWKELLLTLHNGTERQHGLLSSSLAWSLSSFTSQEDEGNGSESLLTSPLPPSSLMSTTPWQDMTTDEQEKLLKRWGKQRGRHGTKREKTEDRIVLAERLRRQLELVEPPACKEEADASLAQLYGDYINSATDL
ncbi:hypothetical protein ACHAWT_010206 [Skeletonema menzelii]